MHIRLSALALLFTACSGEPALGAAPGAAAPGATAAAPSAPPAAPASTAATSTASTPTAATAAPLAIGWDHLPADPGPSARAANAAALRLHAQASGASEEEARRVYEGSLAAFQRVAEENPDYLFARFNVACALARLGRSEEAIAILRALLALDLPTFGPRLDADPDLASLPDALGFGALTEHRAALRARYAAALGEGAPLVRVTATEAIAAAGEDVDGRQRRTLQAGVWLANERRFVPMAPLLVQEVDALVGDLALSALVVDRARDAVLVFEGMGSWSEGGGPITEGALVAYEAGTGVERARLASTAAHGWCPPIRAHATTGGASLRFVEETDDDAFPTRTAGDPFDASALPQITVSLAHASVILPHGAAPEGVILVGDTLRRGELTATLAPAHHFPPRRGIRTATWVQRDAQHAWLLTAGIEPIEWDSMRAAAPALSAVTFGEESMTVELLSSAPTGVGALVAAPDGSAYAQIGDRTFRLVGDGAPEPLPEGLRILAGPPGEY